MSRPRTVPPKSSTAMRAARIDPIPPTSAYIPDWSLSTPIVTRELGCCAAAGPLESTNTRHVCARTLSMPVPCSDSAPAALGHRFGLTRCQLSAERPPPPHVTSILSLLFKVLSLPSKHAQIKKIEMRG